MPERDCIVLRRAIERLRDGLFDPEAVKQLTIEDQTVQSAFSKGLELLENRRAEPLCICGSYGQGKSHTLLHFKQRALEERCAASMIQLDFREMPFHRFQTVYQAIMVGLLLPDDQTFLSAWKQKGDVTLLEGLHGMPHRFRLILEALLRRSKKLTASEKELKKHRGYQPAEFRSWLESGLAGDNIPTSNLKKVLKYREVQRYEGQSLMCRGNLPYLEMVRSLGELLNRMGYKGLVLLFDEGESIAQMRQGARAKSYHLLDKLFTESAFVFPIFAFTEDFFDKVNEEPYDDEKALFTKNYSEAWRSINRLHLKEMPQQGGRQLLDQLLELYERAYALTLPSTAKEKLQSLLQKVQGQETRAKLRALVTTLDMESQQHLLK